jgi:hypothetical protein
MVNMWIAGVIVDNYPFSGLSGTQVQIPRRICCPP